jgi:hypothetical protein
MDLFKGYGPVSLEFSGLVDRQITNEGHLLKSHGKEVPILIIIKIIISGTTALRGASRR